MSTTTRGKVPTGATAADCARLWITLTQEYIPALRLEIRMVTDSQGNGWLSVEVVDDSVVAIEGQGMVNVWAAREFRSELYLISVDQLFQLLIVAHKQIDQYFRLGTPHAPALRPK